MVFIADIPVACAAGMASRMESDFRGFFSTSALVYGFIGNGVAVVYTNSEGLRRTQNFHSLRSWGNWSWELRGNIER